ncbi:hypothetical protein [Streptomyces sp. NPDC047718]|uniref:hypothetical protein n=1 Tax=Streptomyces sp. NPDC047718 TaxID=3155479 RepID=UPI0033D1B49E
MTADRAARPDLLALTEDTLAALANRGLVKRAAKELAAGAGAVVGAAADGSLTGRFPDGTEAVLPPGAGIDLGTCSCAATGTCRHLLGLILAYRQQATPEPEPTAPATAAGGDTPAAPDAPTGAAAPAVPGPAGGPDGSCPPVRSRPPGAADSTPEPGGTPFRDGAAAGEGGPTGGGPDGIPVWSPGSVTDQELTAALGARAVAAARRTLTRGYSARLTHPGPGAPEARAELATATVRFTVPGALGYAVTDARPEQRGPVVALAVWAFRAALAADPADPPADVRAGGPLRPARSADEAARAAAGLAADLLLDGAAHAGPVLAAGLHRVRGELAGHGMHWTADTIADLAEQLAEHASRGARHRPERSAELLAEVAARHRTGRHGTGEPGTTPLRRVRLTGLGCRVTGDAASRTAEVYFAHARAGVSLVLRRRWELTDAQAAGDRPAPHGPDLARRRVAGTTFGALAAGNVVSETASRTPGHVVAFGASRTGGTGVTTVGGSWTGLPEPLLVRDFGGLAERVRARPPRPVRARVAADDLHVLAVHAVEDLGYDPAEQRVEAVLRDARGNRALLAAPYNPYAPGGLDALLAALGSIGGGPCHLSGFVRAAAGSGPVGSPGPVVEPLAVLAGSAVVVPDLAAGPPTAGTAPAARPAPDPVAGALAEALGALADTAHRGLRRLDRAGLDRLDRAAAALDRTGLATAASRVRAVPAAVAGGGADAAVGPWTDAQLFLLTAADLYGSR